MFETSVRRYDRNAWSWRRQRRQKTLIVLIGAVVDALPYTVMNYIVMAYIVMADTVVAYIGMVYIGMTDIIMAYICGLCCRRDN